MTLADAFEAGTLDPAAFPHRAHVSVTFSLAQRYSREEAYARLVAGLRALTRRAGRPERFHETITRAWFELISQTSSLERHPELFDKRLLSRYYSRERLAAGRECFVEPDLRPLRLDSLGETPRISGKISHAHPVAPVIFHITSGSAWDAARPTGRYVAPSLTSEGFIHLSDLEQVLAVAKARFSGQGELVLLCVAVDRLEAPLRYETSDAGDERFPHLYGPLNLDAVIAVAPFVETDDGFAVPAEVVGLRP